VKSNPVKSNPVKPDPAQPKQKTPKSGTAAVLTPLRDDPAVAVFLEGLGPPLSPLVGALRARVLAVSPDIGEGVKWNTPSFYVIRGGKAEWFATTHLRGGPVSLILHLGAKVRDTAVSGVEVEDPAGLLTWLARDRAILKIADESALLSQGPAIDALLRAWIGLL
jgi:hypothetical protein